MNKKLAHIGLVMVVAFAGCGGVDDGYEYDETMQALNFTGSVIYDAGFLCTVGGTTMHCCPPGYAMIGARVDRNVFKCGQLTVAGGQFLDIGTVRNGMHACPAATVMVGFHAGKNQLACQAPSPAPSFEYVDGVPSTTDSYPMHICPGGYAMAGIHLNNDLFTCDS
jgi:hypothetical protein